MPETYTLERIEAYFDKLRIKELEEENKRLMQRVAKREKPTHHQTKPYYEDVYNER